MRGVSLAPRPTHDNMVPALRVDYPLALRPQRKHHVQLDRGISDADPAGEPCQAIHASKANLSIECHFDTY